MINLNNLKNALISKFPNEYDYPRKEIYSKVPHHEKAATYFTVAFRTDYRNKAEIYIRFYSYGTRVMQVSLYEEGEDMWGYPNDLVINGLYSATTRKHIGWWLGLLRNWGVIPCTWDYYTIKKAYEERGEHSFGRLYL